MKMLLFLVAPLNQRGELFIERMVNFLPTSNTKKLSCIILVVVSKWHYVHKGEKLIMVK
jgi:hypothetical protein